MSTEQTRADAPGGPGQRPPEPSLARSTALMATGTLLSRITGLLRVTVLVATLGVGESRLADVYNVANTTPNIIYELVLGGILSSIFVPVFVEVRNTRGQRQAWHVARATMTIAIAGLGLLAGITMLAAPWIIRLYVHSGSPAERAEAIELGGQLLAMFMPQIVFYGVGAVMTGLLNAHRRFGVPMFAPILNNLVVIAVGLTFHALVGQQVPQVGEVTTGQKLLLGLGTTAGVVAMTMVQWPFLRRIGFRFHFVWNWRDRAIRKMATLSAYTVGYVVTNQLGYLLVPVLAYGVRGGYTAYTTAFIFFQLPHGVFAVSVMTALLPPLSEYAVARDWAAFRATMARGIRLTAAVLLPAALGYLALAGPIVRLLLEHGVVTEASTSLLVPVLMVFVLGLVPFSTFQLVLRAFYALQDTRTTFRVNLVSVGVNVVVDLLLFNLLPQRWKIPGLAFGHVSSYTVGSALLLYLLSRRIGGLEGSRILGAVGRMLVAGLVMVAATLLVARGVAAAIDPGLGRDLVTVVAGVIVGAGTYLAVARLLRVEELALLLDVVRRRRTRGRPPERRGTSPGSS
ncbi:MAG TPA: murein biosynthesis integral membrane protein MurJ [Actinomycetota bacterium]|nr:murein biosynthesis integral membrane protein MurJ [Actinomycetota bacterium]